MPLQPSLDPARSQLLSSTVPCGLGLLVVVVGAAVLVLVAAVADDDARITVEGVGVEVTVTVVVVVGAGAGEPEVKVVGGPSSRPVATIAATATAAIEMGTAVASATRTGVRIATVSPQLLVPRRRRDVGGRPVGSFMLWRLALQPPPSASVKEMTPRSSSVQ